MAVDEQGLFAVETKPSFVVTDVYESGPDFIDVVKDWAGTRISPPLAQRLSDATVPVALHQDVRLRVFRVERRPQR